jgi:hypothetical protein
MVEPGSFQTRFFLFTGNRKGWWALHAESAVKFADYFRKILLLYLAIHIFAFLFREGTCLPLGQHAKEMPI